MKRYIYKAKDKKTGNLLTGEVEAFDAQTAAKLVRDRGYLVISITPVTESISSLLKRLKSRITHSDVTAFTRQFATMINAGLPITESLSILRSQSRPAMATIINQILVDVEGGQPLSKGLERYPKVFSSTYVALIKAGEAGGVLDNVLARLADNLEKEAEFRGKVKGALIYPAIIVIGMVVVASIMMIFVIPKLTGLYADFDVDLPAPTRILMGVSDFVIRFWPVFILLFLGLGWGVSAYRKTPSGRLATDRIIFRIPIFGDLERQIILTELTRTLSMMVGAGVSILEGLAITAGVVRNRVISDALKDASTQIEKGFPIAFSFAKHPEAFPYLVSQMVAVGEETGKMEDVLIKISKIFEIESDQKVKGLTSAIEPVVMILLGLGVGFLVIAVILPIYNLTSQF